MAGEPHFKRTRRRLGLTLLALAIVLLLLSGSALAVKTVMKDDFTAENGSPPDDEEWEVVVDDVSSSAEIQNNSLRVSGMAAARTKEPFDTFQLSVEVYFSPVNLSGTPIEIVLESEEDEKVTAMVTVEYDTTHGWSAVFIVDEEEHTNHSGVVNVEVNEWYRVLIAIDQETFAIHINKTIDGTPVWEYEKECDEFMGENFIELASQGGIVRYDTFSIIDDQYYWQDNPQNSVTIVMFAIFFTVLFLPFLYRPVEHNLEAFLFAMGFTAVTMNTLLLDRDKIIVHEGGEAHFLPPFWTKMLVEAALWDPIMITAAVLIAGLVFHYGRDYFKMYMEKAIEKLHFKVFIFIIIVTLGMVASLITAIISALLLVEVITVLRLDRKSETEITILACFAIGLGAALTPVGEPLSTIVIVTKLQEDFFYLLIHIGPYVIPTVIAFGIIGYFYAGRSHVSRDTLSEDQVPEERKEVFIRAGKVYLFVMALVLLGTGFAPLIEWYIIKLPPMALYWVNTSSAILDNATLAAAEITWSMTQEQINAALMSLLISGGMLIPGNIPNIIAAGKLHITSKSWATFGVPIGAIWLAIFFVILFILRI